MNATEYMTLDTVANESTDHLILDDGRGGVHLEPAGAAANEDERVVASDVADAADLSPFAVDTTTIGGLNSP